ncbi:putative dehydrogenase [Pasteurella langaaensis DSM 22999]|uniref:Putative dehydrogenase n=1 Tax=Alitibacter langaaensis DSM 22999 TaxID=1122935 RepID=A0A2U0T8H1_9PAST|nr:Gfo/Idh/MocA family oxidoreductase [Pasteurella langaaensis]PVX39847.1 putative dehydrogenase [Pasteurella langaaensis DSM 22999]
MKIGLVGTGMIVNDLLHTLNKTGVEAISIWGRNVAKAKEIATQFHIPTVFERYEDLLASEFDTIYIGLPNHLHFQFAKQALEAGKHVIMEKPFTPTMAEFQSLRTLAKNQGVMLIEAVTTHYLPAYQQLKTELSHLGDIKIVSLNYSQYSSRYDRFKNGDIAPAFDPKQAGGALMDLNVYNLNFAVGLFGEPKSYIYAPNIERNIDTSGVLLLNYGHFQAVCIGAKDCQAPVMLSIQGTKGNITIPMPANVMNVYQVNDNKGNSEQHEFENRHRMFYEFKEFVRIIDGKDHETAEKMLDISEIVCETLESARMQAGIRFDV